MNNPVIAIQMRELRWHAAWKRGEDPAPFLITREEAASLMSAASRTPRHLGPHFRQGCAMSGMFTNTIYDLNASGFGLCSSCFLWARQAAPKGSE
jgi:hypothetical protein